tara:strand:+ start:8913 stop:11435 length:2523 start_codon:yes stop_codon:yes gene_type:complete
MSSIIFLSEATPAMADTIGNKAASLAELRLAGLNVPKGYSIPVEYYREWRSKGEMGHRARDAILAAFENLRAPVAVRSSSPAEDRADASFAGQYETILGVRTPEQLLEAVVRCWASAFSEAAIAYRREHGTPLDADMAVLVQELVPATSAGVLFTQHPVTDRIDQVVINANFGLGDSVVSGKADPDTFILDKESGQTVDVREGSKKTMTTMLPDGVEDRETPASLLGTRSLSNSQLAQLADVARKLEAHYDQPIDAEWAFENDTLHMLQARPITTGRQMFYTQFLDAWAKERGLADDPDAIWTRGSPISSLPTSPLYYSEMAAFFSDMFPAIAELHGGKAPKRKEFRYVDGFTYTNREFSSTADPAGTVQPTGLLSPQWRSTLKLSLKHPRTLAVWSNIDRYYKNWAEKWGPEIEANRPDYARAKPEEIRPFIERLEDQRRARSMYAACGVGFASDLLGLLQYLLLRWAPDASEDAIGLLTSGVPGSLTHQENMEVWRLADLIRSNERVGEVLIDGRFDDLNEMPEARPFLAEVDKLRVKRPHRGCSDRDLNQKRWGDTRDALLAQISNMIRLGAGADPDAAHDRTAARRKTLEHSLLEHISRGPLGAVRAKAFRVVLKATQRYWMHRDNQRHTFDRYFYELRCAYRAIGRRLNEAGILPDPDAIFFLGKREIYDFLDKKLSAERLRNRAAWREEWWRAATTKEPAPCLKGNQPHDLGFVMPEGCDLAGIGGAPGQATGPVRLVHNMRELSEVKPGEIIVTQAIDPAWTPVFGIVGGVISEEGGMLSHATVLGREYGLPVVIGALGATTLLQTGEIVMVNGSAGTVHRVPVPEPLPQEAA